MTDHSLSIASDMIADFDDLAGDFPPSMGSFTGFSPLGGLPDLTPTGPASSYGASESRTYMSWPANPAHPVAAAESSSSSSSLPRPSSTSSGVVLAATASGTSTATAQPMLVMSKSSPVPSQVRDSPMAAAAAQH